MPLIEVLAAMERAGVKLDAKRLAEIGEGMAERIAELEREIYELAGHEFTIGSPQQLGEVLFDELGLTKKRRGKTGFSTDARVLAQIRDEHEIVAKVESWRELTKLKNTYLDALPDLDRPRDGPHPHHLQPGRRGDRAALEHQPEPPEHPDPLRDRAPGARLLRRRARACGCSPPTTTRSSCGSSPTSPARTCCARSSPPARTSTARPPPRSSAIPPDEVGPAERSKAKMVNYGIAYGLSAFGLADRLQISREEAATYIERYFERFPAIQRFIDETIATAEQRGVRLHAAGPPAGDPRAALRASASAARSASGWPSTR